MSKKDFLDDMLYKAKNVADVASKKTGDAWEAGKLRYLIKQTDFDMEKAYSKLGAIYYESRKSDEDFSDAVGMAVEEIDILAERLEELNEKLRTYKKVLKCKNCGKENEQGSVFCNRCGSTFPVGERTLAERIMEPDEAEPREEE